MQEINGRKKMISDLCGNYTALVNAKNQIARAQDLFENLKVTFSAANSKYKSRRGRLIVYHILLIVLFIAFIAVGASGGGDDLPPAAIPFFIGTMVLFYAVTVAGTLLMVKNVIGRIVCIVWPVPGYIFSIVAIFKKPRSEGSYKLNEAENNLVNARQAYGNLLAKFPQAQNSEKGFVNYIHLMVKAKCDELKSLGAEAEAINCLNYTTQ